MRSPARAYRSRTLLWLIALGATASCARDPVSIDLLPLVPTAERRAGGNVDDSIQVAPPPNEHEPALLLRAPARITFALKFPTGARLVTTASLVTSGAASSGATLRVGISDDRRYDGVFQLEMGHEPESIDVDLGAYAGWQWSLFYRPSEITWKLIINADATPAGTIALRRLRIVNSARPTVRGLGAK